MREIRTTFSARCGALILTLTACGDAAERDAGFTVTDSSGVTIARNASPAPDTVVFDRPAQRFGMEEGSPEYLFEYLSDVEPLADGRVVVVDNRGGRVALFDAAGRWVRDIGRRGSGPGEYTSPYRVWQEDGRLHVWDPVARRISRYDADGAFVDGETLAWKGTASPLVRLGGSWIDERESGHRLEPGPARGALVRLGSDGTLVDTLLGPYTVPRVGWQITDAATGQGHMINPPTFSAPPLWTVANDRLYWASGAEPRVEIFDRDGTRVRSVVLARAVEPVTAAAREAHARGLQRRFGLSEDAVARVRDEGEYTTVRPAVSGLLVDDAGRLWIAEHEPGLLGSEVGHRWDVTDPEGRVRRHVQFPHGFQLLRLRGQRAFGMTVLPSGVHVADAFDLSPL
jgi:hypothetical protein